MSIFTSRWFVYYLVIAVAVASLFGYDYLRMVNMWRGANVPMTERELVGIVKLAFKAGLLWPFWVPNAILEHLNIL